MYVNKCIKCGREFETKNPKRVICPDCLYPDKKMAVSSTDLSSPSVSTEAQTVQEPLRGYSAGPEEPPRYYSAGGNEPQRYNRPQRQYNNQGGYNRSNNNYNRNYSNNRSNNYSRDNRQSNYNRNNNYNNRQSGYQNNRPQQGSFNRQSGYQSRRPQQGGFSRGPKRPVKNRAPKQLLVSREQLEQIEMLYKAMLPLPNPDCHEVIGEKIGLEPRKVFFGINLVRQKMMLPKLPFPKRKLAISPDQLFAIKNLYEPLLPLPPIGCHKIIAAQLKMDEWRVHVGIGLIRSQMGLQRWNQDRPDAPEEFKTQNSSEEPKTAKTSKKKEKVEVENTSPEQTIEETSTEEVKPKKRGRKPKAVQEEVKAEE